MENKKVYSVEFVTSNPIFYIKANNEEDAEEHARKLLLDYDVHDFGCEVEINTEDDDQPTDGEV